MGNEGQSNIQLSWNSVGPKHVLDPGAKGQQPESFQCRPNRIVYEGEDCLVPELFAIGKDRFFNAMPQGLSRHIHKGLYEICYIVQGQVRWWVEGVVYEVNRGDIFITRPDELHGGVDELMHPCDLYWLIIHIPEDHTPLTGLFLSETNQLVQDLQGIDCRVFPGLPSVEKYLAQILAQHHLSSPYAAPLVRAQLHQFLISIIQSHLEFTRTDLAIPEVKSDSIQQAQQWIEAHLAETYHIKEVAQAMNMSVSYFHQRFLQETGLTPVEYRTWSRIEEAKRLLHNSDRSILQIAQALGFSTSQYFATVFKKLEGLTPREYRRKGMM